MFPKEPEPVATHCCKHCGIEGVALQYDYCAVCAFLSWLTITTEPLK